MKAAAFFLTVTAILVFLTAAKVAQVVETMAPVLDAI